MDFKKAFETNRETWNKKVAVHAASEFYNLNEYNKIPYEIFPNLIKTLS